MSYAIAAILLSRHTRWFTLTVVLGTLFALAVAASRMYVGAHLPLDVLGGAALGLTVAGAVRLLAGRPDRAHPVLRAGTARNAHHGE